MPTSVAVKGQVPNLQLRDFGDASPGIVEEEKQRVFALPSTVLAVRNREHRFHLLPRQPADRRQHRLLRGDRADVAAPFDLCGIAASHKAGEGPDGGEPLIARPDGTSALLLEMGKEFQYKCRGEVLHGQAFDGLPDLSAREGQEQLERVAIARASVPGQIALADDILS